MRLDAVIRVKERVEERAGQELVRVESAVTAAKSKVEDARRAASQDFRARSDVSHWEVTETAHHRALVNVKLAQKELESLQKSAHVVRGQYLDAHRSAETVRRVAANRREEAARQLSKAEDKALDDVASLLHFRRTG